MWSREDRRTLVLLLPLLVLAVAAFLLLEPKTPRSGAPPDAAKEAPPELFEFDPNTVDYRALRRLGFTKQDAAGCAIGPRERSSAYRRISPPAIR